MKKNISPPTPTPDTEVSEKATRRQFTAKYKLQILDAVAACTEPGQIGAFLRREGLYQSHLAHWRAARKKGSLGALAPQKRGPKVLETDARDARIAALERDLRKVTCTDSIEVTGFRCPSAGHRVPCRGMEKRYIINLTRAEREGLEQLVKRARISGVKRKRAIRFGTNVSKWTFRSARCLGPCT